MPKVSILIPTYERPEFLGEAIDAVLASTHGNLEVVVGDDGELGASVCAARPDPRLRYVKHPQRLGMARNWNVLLDLAQGDLIGLCMDDDRLAPTFVERCVAAFDADPELDVVFSNHDFVGPEGRRTRVNALAEGRHDDFASAFLTHLPVAVSAALMRRSAWAAVRPLPDTAAADMVLFGRLAEQGSPFFYVDEPLMAYRAHGAMLSGTGGFKTDRIAAWEALNFTDSEAKAQHRELLAEALLSRAKLRVRSGDADGARQDASRARGLGTTTQRWQARLVLALSKTPLLAPAARGAVQALRQARSPAASGRSPRADRSRCR